MDEIDIPDHPAKFSKPILDAIREIIAVEVERLGPDYPRRPRLLDPFAGVGKIHQLEDVVDTVGIELEKSWADAHPRTEVGDATDLRFQGGEFDIVGTSCCYGNRMADLYEGDAKESQRYTYRISLGHELSFNSAAGMQWGSEYRSFHVAAWREALRVLVEAGLLIVNVSNHVRDDQVQRVVEWHLTTLIELGCSLVEARPVETQRMGNGANRNLRVDAEMLLVVRTPVGQARLL